jgi:isopenicillin-N N-acyltransferase like protein
VAKKNKWKKIFIYSSVSFILLIIIFAIFFKIAVTLHVPLISDFSPLKKERIQVSENFYRIDNNWIRKNKYGLWELYVEGDPFNRGVALGKLSQELVYRQEYDLIKQIKEVIPSDYYRNIVKLFVAWFDRDLDSYIGSEYLKEIYGVSQSASHQFDYIAPSYQRILNYHAAHDIGHALEGMYIVGCTSFSAWGKKTDDGNLIVGRNFDFYLNDDFAKDKIVAFINPSNGYKFMMVTWGGMIGVVSGMNEKGLTVTLNAAKSEIPLSAATPISIVAREILQYARNITEAYSIANKRKVFVSESMMIGSREDNKTVVIEKTPSETELYSKNDEYIICTNHYQSDKLKDSKLNIDNKNESASLYRFNRVDELIHEYPKISYKNTAAILRDQRGIANADIGWGNEKAINQLIAHHSIIFDPHKKLVWVSTNPYQLGAYVAYDLNKVFSSPNVIFNNLEMNEESLTIPADTSFLSNNFQIIKRYREIKITIKKYLSTDSSSILEKSVLSEFVQSNPNYYDVYSLLGDYYKKHADYARAIVNYKNALTKEIPTLKEVNAIKEKLTECSDHR